MLKKLYGNSAKMDLNAWICRHRNASVGIEMLPIETIK
jgi:hypothetical protein